MTSSYTGKMVKMGFFIEYNMTSSQTGRVEFQHGKKGITHKNNKTSNTHKHGKKRDSTQNIKNIHKHVTYKDGNNFSFYLKC